MSAEDIEASKRPADDHLDRAALAADQGGCSASGVTFILLAFFFAK